MKNNNFISVSTPKIEPNDIRYKPLSLFSNMRIIESDAIEEGVIWFFSSGNLSPVKFEYLDYV